MKKKGQVALLLLEGCDNPEIAKRLHIKVRTVKHYMRQMFIKHGIKTGIKRVKLATLLYRESLRSNL